MEFDLILNELSLQNPAPNVEIARQRMSCLIKTIKAIKDQGVKIIFRTQYDFYTTILAPEYPLRRWLNDKEYVDQVEQNFIRALTTKTPFSDELTNSEVTNIESNTGLSEFWHQEEQVIGFGVAYILNTIALSLLSEERWNCSRIQMKLRQIDENGEIFDEDIEIIHASCIDHVQEHANWFQNRIRTAVHDGLELWSRREELFPRLIFCSHLNKQLENLKSGNPMLRQVERRLSELEDYCKIWISGSFNRDNLKSKASPESDSRLNQFRQKLIFRCPDDEERRFSWHVRMTPGAWRLYFFVDLEPGKLIIGYIGSKIL